MMPQDGRRKTGSRSDTNICPPGLELICLARIEKPPHIQPAHIVRERKHPPGQAQKGAAARRISHHTQ